MKTTKRWLPLPEAVPNNCYRFFCRFVRTDLFENTTVLDIDGEEVSLYRSQFKVGEVNGKLCVDIKEGIVKQLGLA